MTQKERWAAKAARYLKSAEAAEARASALISNHCTDWAFISQPGHLPARARQIAQTNRALELRQKAAGWRAKAAELHRMANTHRGDAEARRQALRDAIAVKPGDTVVTALYGPREVVRVNKKTITVRDSFGGTMTVDKAHCRAA